MCIYRGGVQYNAYLLESHLTTLSNYSWQSYREGALWEITRYMLCR